MTSSIFKGIAAGFFATFIMALVMYFGANLAEFPPLIVVLAGISHRVIGSPLWPWIGWAYHFAIGTLAWGILFGAIAGALRLRSGFGSWFTAIVFAVCAWVLMMIIVMPLAGYGFFARNFGLNLFFSMLILHVIWGTVLGLEYYALGACRTQRRETREPLGRPLPNVPPPREPVMPPTVPRGGENF